MRRYSAVKSFLCSFLSFFKIKILRGFEIPVAKRVGMRIFSLTFTLLRLVFGTEFLSGSDFSLFLLFIFQAWRMICCINTTENKKTTKHTTKTKKKWIVDTCVIKARVIEARMYGYFQDKCEGIRTQKHFLVE